LNRVLADEFALSTATRDYHWKVTGAQQRSLYELFDEQYHEMDRLMETIVERSRGLGLEIHTAWPELTHNPNLSPEPGAKLNPDSMLQNLAELHRKLALQINESLTASAAVAAPLSLTSLLNDLIEYHETTSWVLGELLEDRELAQA
jgi:starvation-inducible DNA-binding protein